MTPGQSHSGFLPLEGQSKRLGSGLGLLMQRLARLRSRSYC